MQNSCLGIPISTTVNVSNLKNNTERIIEPKKIELTELKFNYETPIIKEIKDCTIESIPGASIYKRKLNQDNGFIFKQFGNMENTAFFGILDGHGSNGHLVSGYAKKIFPVNMEMSIIKYNCLESAKTNIETKCVLLSKSQKAKLLLKNDINTRHEVLMESFKKTNNDLHLSGIDLKYSGTTLVVALVLDNLLICANVGDSRAILGSLLNTNWNVRALSRDHKPDLPEEYERIKEQNGRVDSLRDSKGNPIGPKRVWKLNENVPGLSMSRALGDDSGTEIGIISTPEIIEETLKEEDKILV